MARAMGAGRGGAEGEKRNETVERGVVCVCVITQRACVHVCRTPPHARPRSPQLKAREVANANLQPKNNNSSRGPQSAAGPPAGEPAAAEIRLKQGRPRRPPPRPPRRAPAGRSPAAPKTAPACRHGPRSLAWKQSHRRIDGGGKSIGMQNPTPDRKWDVVKERKVPSELRIAHGVNTHQTFHCIAHLHACTAAHAAVDRER